MCLIRASISRTLAVAVLVISGVGGAALAQSSNPPKANRPFHVDVDEDGIKTFILIGKKPINDADLLPAAAQAPTKSLASTDLAQVPEVSLEEPLSKTGSKQEALEAMEFRFAKVNYFNLKKTDGFLHALLARRPDLEGLPFKMGTDCRLSEEQALSFGSAIGRVRGEGDKLAAGGEYPTPALAAALMQIQGPKEKQAELARTLGTIPYIEATTALARLALFSPDTKARELAAQGLKVRRDQDYTDMLMDGLRYPWPTVARRAAEALVRLDRKDVLSRLVLALEAPDPRMPVQHQGAWQARELVRINHHRNCLLCHPPANTKVVLQVSDDAKDIERQRIKVVEKERKDDAEHLHAPPPLPNRSFESNANSYRGDRDMDHILVRVDVTYLRQDFSAFLPVADAAPWPDFQRFDFLVRTRTLTEAEATALRQTWQPRKEGSLSPYQQAALFALRELTGLEATTPTDWRRLLKLSLQVNGSDK